MILICAFADLKRIVNKCSIYATLPAPSVQQLRCWITAGDYFVSKQSREKSKKYPYVPAYNKRILHTSRNAFAQEYIYENSCFVPFVHPRTGGEFTVLRFRF